MLPDPRATDARRNGDGQENGILPGLHAHPVGHGNGSQHGHGSPLRARRFGSGRIGRNGVGGGIRLRRRRRVSGPFLAVPELRRDRREL
ncbi:MAG: hypothetical protein HY561_05120 [Gemmatimonadetes bacterium]|nr:hypothetical protein [Gemmatimonadota bacterium]